MPDWFAHRHLGGKRLAAGFRGYFSIVQTGPASMGPAPVAFDGDVLAGAPASVPSVDLVGNPHHGTTYGDPDRCRRDTDYRDDFTGWNPRGADGYWTWADQMEQAGTWVDTPLVSGPIFAPMIGNGRAWYETSTPHAERASHWWFVYQVRARRTLALPLR